MKVTKLHEGEQDPKQTLGPKLREQFSKERQSWEILTLNTTVHSTSSPSYKGNP